MVSVAIGAGLAASQARAGRDVAFACPPPTPFEPGESPEQKVSRILKEKPEFVGKVRVVGREHGNDDQLVLYKFEVLEQYVGKPRKSLEAHTNFHLCGYTTSVGLTDVIATSTYDSRGYALMPESGGWAGDAELAILKKLSPTKSSPKREGAKERKPTGSGRK